MKQRMQDLGNNFNQELKFCINNLREKRENIIRQIQQEEKEKRKLEDQIDTLTEQHSKLIDSLSKRRSKKKEYDKTIEQTEKAYQKILESSHTLLHVLKNEVHNLGRHDDHDDHDDSR